MSAIDTAGLRALLAAATPGPWRQHEDEPRVFVAEHRPHLSLLGLTEDNTAIVFFEKDAAFVVAMRNALPALLDELEALQAEVAQLRGDTEKARAERDGAVRMAFQERHEAWKAQVALGAQLERVKALEQLRYAACSWVAAMDRDDLDYEEMEIIRDGLIEATKESR